MLTFEEVLPGIYLLKAPFAGLWTGVTLVRGDRNFLIDSSAEEQGKDLLPALENLGVKITEIDWLLNTHCHGDHIGGHHALVTRYGLKTAVIGAGADALRDPAKVAIRIRTKFPGTSPPPQSWLKGVEPDRILAEGEFLEGRLFPIHTPGHEVDCVCWYDVKTKTVISGDALQGNGTSLQGIGFYQDLKGYRASLAHLAEYDIENIICGHAYAGIGDIVREKGAVRAALDACGRCVELYDRRLREYLKGFRGLCGEAELAKLSRHLIGDVGCAAPPERLFLSMYTVAAHVREIREASVNADGK